MTAQATPAFTDLLKAWEKGDQNAFASVMRHVNSELQRMALSRLRGADTPSLAAGDLLNEAVLKLMGGTPSWRDRVHFFATVAVTMRSVLVLNASRCLALSKISVARCIETPVVRCRWHACRRIGRQINTAHRFLP